MTNEEEGNFEIQVRVLGNELIAIKMAVIDFKVKWLIIGIIALMLTGWGVSSFGPPIIDMFESTEENTYYNNTVVPTND